MRVEEIRQLLAREPFQPFVAHVAGGRSIEVRDAEFALVSPDGRSLFVYDADFTHLVDVDAIAMVSIRGRHASMWERPPRQGM